MKFEPEWKYKDFDDISRINKEALDALFNTIKVKCQSTLTKTALFDTMVDRIEEAKAWVHNCILHDQRKREQK